MLDADPNACAGTSAPQLVIECRLCSAVGRHVTPSCPYLRHVPKSAQVGPAGTIVCKCGRKEGGHSDHDDWVGYAVMSLCRTCGMYGDQRTEGCPGSRRNKEQIE